MGSQVACLIFLVFCFGYIRTGLSIQSWGYRFIGGGAGLIALMFLFLAGDVYVVAIVLGGLGFLILHVGFGLLMTKERSKDSVLRKSTSVLQRLTGRIPDHVVKAVCAGGVSTPTEPPGRARRKTLSVGVFSIVVGVALWLWGGQVVYPVLLVASGLVFVALAWFGQK
jgi:Na+/H+-dicarboxylate symporter